MALHDTPQTRDCERGPAGERELEDMAEAEE